MHDTSGVFGNPLGVCQHLDAEAGRQWHVVFFKHRYRIGNQTLAEFVVGPRAADNLAPLVIPVDRLFEHVTSTFLST